MENTKNIDPKKYIGKRSEVRIEPKNGILPNKANTLPIKINESKIIRRVTGANKMVFHLFIVSSIASLTETKLLPLSCFMVKKETAELDSKREKNQNKIPK